jgi:hypothetical protein
MPGSAPAVCLLILALSGEDEARHGSDPRALTLTVSDA